MNLQSVMFVLDLVKSKFHYVGFKFSQSILIDFPFE